MSEKKKVVFFGGGTGLSTLLGPLKHNPWIDIHAVVTMFDSGGSSGVLRDRYGILPPSDILRCLMALGDDSTNSIREMLLRRIPREIKSVASKSEHPAGHTAGNLMLTAFVQEYGLEGAIDVLSGMFAVKGHVYPVTLQPSNLSALFFDESCAESEVAVDQGIHDGKKIKELSLNPQVDANPTVLDVIKNADAICIGPGSFYTSVLPNFLPTGIKKAIKTSRAPIIFILNLMTEGPGMKDEHGKDMTGEDFIWILQRYVGRKAAGIIVNTSLPKERLDAYAQEGKYPIVIKKSLDLERYVEASLWEDGTLARHDPRLLSYALTQTIFELTGRP